MPSLTCFNFRFTPNWLMMILAASFMSLFVYLGFWQIDRAQEKREMLAKEKSNALQAPMAWKTTDTLPSQYQKVSLQGHYLPYLFLLDNQHYNHKFGYDVLSPFQLNNGEVVIIDRGWVIGDITRQTIPKIEFPVDVNAIQGSAYFPAENHWVLGPLLEEKENNVTIVERMDAKLITQILQKKVYPFIIRLDKQDAHGFVREWAIVSMPPERHLAYALQWFVMALIILIIFVALNLKKER